MASLKEQISAKYQEYGTRFGIDVSGLPYDANQGEDERPQLQITVDGMMSGVIYERGTATSRKTTSSVDELLYWVFRDFARAKGRSVMRLPKEQRPDGDLRRAANELAVKSLTDVSPEWGTKLASEINKELEGNPYTG